jgi:vancomycin resistance protein VanW
MTLHEASRAALLTRQAKIAAHSTRRLLQWSLRSDFAAPTFGDLDAPVVYRTRVPLESSHPQHPTFEAGKRHNVRLAAPAFDRLLLSPERPFSFWRTLGPATAAKGYRHGMELASGCIVPAIGGGLCLLARALFQAAVFSGFEILERHGHSLAAVEPPPGVPFGVDATILFPYVDLRFQPVRGRAQLSVKVRDDALLLEVRREARMAGTVELEAVDDEVRLEPEGRVRRNRVLRHVVENDTRLRTDEVAVNRTRLLTLMQQQRSCLTCNEQRCHARVVVP